MDSPVNFTKSFNSPDSVKQMKSFLPATPGCASYFADLVKEERNGIGERKNFSPSSRRTLQYTFLSPATPGYIPTALGKDMSPRQPKTTHPLLRSPHRSLCSPFSPNQNMDTVPPTTVTSIASAQLSTSQYSGNSEASFFKYALRPGIHTSTPILQKSQTASASPLLPFLSPPCPQISLSPGPLTLSPQSGYVPQPYSHIPRPLRRVCRPSSSVTAASTCDEPLDLSMPSRMTQSPAPDVVPIVIRPVDDCDDIMPSTISIKSESSGSITVSTQSAQTSNRSQTERESTPSSESKSKSADEDRESDLRTPSPFYRPLCSLVTPVRHFSPMDISAYPDPANYSNTPSPPCYSTTMTPRAREILQKWYMWNSPTSVPSQEVLEALSQRTGMSPTVFTCWINSQRAAVNAPSSSNESSISSLPVVVTPSISRKRRASSSLSSPTAPAVKRPFREKIPVSAESISHFTTQGMFKPNYQPPSGYRPDEIINFLYFIPSPCT